MADRIMEQAQNLPIESSGDNVLNEFKREVAFGIYSRKRVSLSNMQPSFIWVSSDMAKKSDVLNESVVCTMSASKVTYGASSALQSCKQFFFSGQPCELSIQLLNSLREILRTGCTRNTEGLEGEQLATLRNNSGTTVVRNKETFISC